MLKKAYSLILGLTIVVIILCLVIVAQIPEPWTTIVAVFAGGAASFAASMLIQSFASHEQSEMIKALTIDAAGVLPLPVAFERLKWLSYATKRPSKNGEKETKWHVVLLNKVGSAGDRFLTYTLNVPNLVGETVLYTCTFIGLQGSVVAILGSGSETSSVFVFDSDVPEAGVYFGAAYLTDWVGDRDLTIGAIGTGNPPDLSKLPENISTALHRWFKKVDWAAVAAYEVLAAEGGREMASKD